MRDTVTQPRTPRSCYLRVQTTPRGSTNKRFEQNTNKKINTLEPDREGLGSTDLFLCGGWGGGLGGWTRLPHQPQGSSPCVNVAAFCIHTVPAADPLPGHMMDIARRSPFFGNLPAKSRSRRNGFA